MDSTTLANSGPLKHFTPRDIFYFAGAAASVIISWVTLGNRVDLVERDFGRVEARQERLAQELVRMDHEGTTASKNGIYTESSISKANVARIEAQEQEIRKMSTMITRIDTNVERLMQDAGRKP